MLLPLIYSSGEFIEESIYLYTKDLVYFILKGSVQLVSQDHYVHSNYGEGSYFGETDILKTNV